VAAARTQHLRATEPPLDALTGGFHTAFVAAAALAALAAVIGVRLLPARPDG
jgi:hypothetical protein